ncbi:MAG: hypothetical protein U0837_03675 [Dehalococcoidia bacterium]
MITPATEAVVRFGGRYRFDEQAIGDLVAFFVAAVAGSRGGRAIISAPSQAVPGIDRGLGEAAFPTHSIAGSPLLLQASLSIELHGRGHDGGKPVMLRAFSGILGCQFDAGLGSERSQGAAEVRVFTLLDEREEVATFAAGAKAPPVPALGEDVERWGLFGVERAEPLEAAPGLLQRRGPADVLDQVYLPLDRLDDIHRRNATVRSVFR